MNNLKIRNILSALFAVLLITVLITGCGKKESNNTSESNKKTETESKNSGTSGMNKMENNMNSNMNSDMNSNMKQDHLMINLPTMQCGTCKENIETAVKKLDGIESINVDKKEKVAHINYDKAKVDLEKIETTITAAGYDANNKKADPEAYKNLDDCCKLPQDQKKNQ